MGQHCNALAILAKFYINQPLLQSRGSLHADDSNALPHCNIGSGSPQHSQQPGKNIPHSVDNGASCPFLDAIAIGYLTIFTRQPYMALSIFEPSNRVGESPTSLL